VRVGKCAFWNRRELGAVIQAGFGCSGTVEERWASGKQAGAHATFARLEREGKLTSEKASQLVGVSPFILHGVDPRRCLIPRMARTAVAFTSKPMYWPLGRRSARLIVRTETRR
jgi:hypothetical protein